MVGKEIYCPHLLHRDTRTTWKVGSRQKHGGMHEHERVKCESQTQPAKERIMSGFTAEQLRAA